MKNGLILLALLTSSIAAMAQIGEAAPVKVETVNDYIFNWMLWIITFTKINFCTQAGAWGIIWYNDNGEMIERCFRTGLIGGRATYSGYPEGRLVK